MRRKRVILTILLAAAMNLAACGQEEDVRETLADQKDAEMAFGGSAAVTTLDAADMFTDRDKEIGYDEEQAVKITLEGNGASCDDASVDINDSDVTNVIVTITEKGTYLVSGTLQGQLVIDAGKEDKLQLVLDNVDISCGHSAAIYVKQADKVFLTLAPGSANGLATEGEYVAVDDNNIDAGIFSRCRSIF